MVHRHRSAWVRFRVSSFCDFDDFFFLFLFLLAIGRKLRIEISELVIKISMEL